MGYQFFHRSPNTTKFRLEAVIIGCDGLPSMFFSKLSLQLVEPLRYIFNYSFYGKAIPFIWSSSNVTPIFKKKGKIDDKKNYRPISLTCVASKLMEQIIYDELYGYFN